EGRGAIPAGARGDARAAAGSRAASGSTTADAGSSGAADTRGGAGAGAESTCGAGVHRFTTSEEEREADEGGPKEGKRDSCHGCSFFGYGPAPPGALGKGGRAGS